jgi:Domain of unknown function (DUF4169)
MGDIINLRRVRKNKARDDAANVAEANRLKFGRSKVEREVTEATKAMSERSLDAHKREDI